MRMGAKSITPAILDVWVRCYVLYVLIICMRPSAGSQAPVGRRESSLIRCPARLLLVRLLILFSHSSRDPPDTQTRFDGHRQGSSE